MDEKQYESNDGGGLTYPKYLVREVMPRCITAVRKGSEKTFVVSRALELIVTAVKGKSNLVNAVGGMLFLQRGAGIIYEGIKPHCKKFIEKIETEYKNRAERSESEH